MTKKKKVESILKDIKRKTHLAQVLN